MKIRIAQLDDLDAVVEIYNQAVVAGEKTADITPVTTAERTSWFAGHIPAKYPLLVAEKNQSIVGYLTLSAYRPGRMAVRYTAEVSFYIDSDHHHQGIASQLLRYALNLCPSLQIKTVFAIVIESNQGSIALLKKFNFEQWGYLPRVAEFDGNEVGHYYYGLRVGE